MCLHEAKPAACRKQLALGPLSVIPGCSCDFWRKGILVDRWTHVAHSYILRHATHVHPSCRHRHTNVYYPHAHLAFTHIHTHTHVLCLDMHCKEGKVVQEGTEAKRSLLVRTSVPVAVFHLLGRFFLKCESRSLGGGGGALDPCEYTVHVHTPRLERLAITDPDKSNS